MDNSPFSRLPAELRNRIYEEVYRTTTFDIVNSQTEPALTRVCRSFRQESLTTFYNETLFVFHAEPLNCDILPAWLRLLSQEKRQAVTRLEIRILRASYPATWAYNFRLGDVPLRKMMAEVGASGLNLSSITIQPIATKETITLIMVAAVTLNDGDVQKQVKSLHCRLTGEEDSSVWW